MKSAHNYFNKFINQIRTLCTHQNVPFLHLVFPKFKVLLNPCGKKRSVDLSGVFLQMSLYGGDVVLQSLQSCLNEILDICEILRSWYETYSVSLQKGVKVEDANNWRPIALLSIT